MQRNFLVTAVVLAGALAAAPGSVSASPLDYQGLAFQSQGPAAGGLLAGAEFTSAGSGPVLAAASASSE